MDNIYKYYFRVVVAYHSSGLQIIVWITKNIAMEIYSFCYNK